jgi:integrase
VGRRRTKHTNLPPRLIARRRGKVMRYYYDTGGSPRKQIPLGADLVAALARYAELETGKGSPVLTTVRQVAERWVKDELRTRAPKTQRDYLGSLTRLYAFFDAPPARLSQLRPKHIRQYLDWRREHPVSANREIALFSVIWNFARAVGATDLPNPCDGIERHRERPRDVYVTDAAYKALCDAADAPLRDYLDLAYLTGQRPADVLRMAETDVVDGYLEVRQAKTGTRLRIEIVGELAALLERIKARKAEIGGVRRLKLLVDKRGRPLTYGSLRGRWETARTMAGLPHLQLRDLRAKAATDTAEAGSKDQAQAQLGHASVTTTERYVRRRGAKVKPTR